MCSKACRAELCEAGAYSFLVVEISDGVFDCGCDWFGEGDAVEHVVWWFSMFLNEVYALEDGVYVVVCVAVVELLIYVFIEGVEMD